MSDLSPKQFATIDRLESGDESSHAMADQHDLIQRRFLTIRIDNLAQLRHLISQVRCRINEGLTGWIRIEPKLKMITDLWNTAEIVEHLDPANRRRPDAMHKEHRNFAGLVRLQHVKTCRMIRLAGPQKSARRSSHVRVIQEIRQRGRRVAFQRHPATIDLHIRIIQRIVQLQDRFPNRCLISV